MTNQFDNFIVALEESHHRLASHLATLNAELDKLRSEAISPEQLATLDRIAAKVASLVPPNPPGA